MTSVIPLELALQIGGMVLTAVGLVAGLKYALNGLRSDVCEIKADVKTIIKSDGEQNIAIEVLETKHEAHDGWLGRLQELIDRRSEG